MNLPKNQGFSAKNVYPNEKGLHIECYTHEDTQGAYKDCQSKGMNVELNETIITWKFHNPRKPIPLSFPLPIMTEEEKDADGSK